MKGKRVIKGRQPSFWWAAPAQGVTEVDLKAGLRRLLDNGKCGSVERPYILPDFAPKGADWDSAEAFADSPMPLAKIRRLILSYLHTMGMKSEVLELIKGLYSGRRVLPTLADKSQYSDSHRLLIGGWSDAQARSYSAMPNLYSAARADLQHDLKENWFP